MICKDSYISSILIYIFIINMLYLLTSFIFGKVHESTGTKIPSGINSKRDTWISGYIQKDYFCLWTYEELVNTISV